MRIAAYSLLAGALLVGCAGAKSVPSAAPQSDTVQSTLNFTIPEAVSASGGTRSPQFVSASTASIVVEYIGDDANNPPSTTGSNPPALATTAATVNVVATGNASPAPGQCITVGTALQCSIQAGLPVGKIDVYLLCYPSPNGVGTLLSSSVTIVQVNSDGSLVQPGTTNAATLNAPTANIAASGASVSLPSALPITPGASLPNPSVTANSYGSGQPGSIAMSSKQTPTYKAADGTTVATNQPITPVTVTDGDTSGNTCLIYLKAGATTATACPFQAGSAVTLSNTSDSYVVAYNNRFIAGSGITLNARLSTSGSLLSTTQTVTITPSMAAAGSALGTASSGGIVFDSKSAKVYTALTSATTPLSATSYNSSTGYGTPATVAVASKNGSSATTLSAGLGALILGPDSNVWFAENNGASATQYVGAYVVNSNAVAPVTGNPTVTPATGAFVEYQLTASAGTAKLTGIAAYNGFIWVSDTLHDMWRIDPTTATVIPNGGTSYTVNTANAATPILASSGGALTATFASSLVALGSNLYVLDSNANKAVQLSVSTSTSPTGNLIASGTLSSSTIASGSPSTFSIYTDGSNVYAQAGNAFTQVSSSLGVTLGTSSFPASTGGIGQGADGWFWTPAATGASYVQAINVSNASQTSSNALCNAGGIVAGANGVALGPDSTLLTAPAGSTSTAAFCGVIY